MVENKIKLLKISKNFKVSWEEIVVYHSKLIEIRHKKTLITTNQFSKESKIERVGVRNH